MSFFKRGKRETSLQQRLVGCQVRQPREKVAYGDRPEGVSHQRVRIKTIKTNEILVKKINVFILEKLKSAALGGTLDDDAEAADLDGADDRHHQQADDHRE